MKTKKINYQKWIEIFFCLLCGVFFFVWSIEKRLDFAPDELMRFHIPEYIFRHGAMPNGDMGELRSEIWGFSYAYYPTFLGPLLSALFMKITSFFTDNQFALVVAARFTSVLSGVTTMFFLLKSLDRLFSKQVKWLMAIFLVCIPQFTFLCSYVNNDIICIAGSSIICYSWILGIQDGWDYKNGTLLAIGVIIDALSYYNSYGWIICSVFVFLGCFIFKVNKNRDYRKMFPLAAFMVGIVLIVVSGFFIRNAVLYDGDFLGMKSLTESSETYGMSNDFIKLKPSERDIAKNLGMSLWEMLEGSHWQPYSWFYLTFVSFIGVFGYMAVYLPNWIYIVYAAFFALGGVLLLSYIVFSLFTIKRYSGNTIKSSILLKVSWLIAFIIPIVLSIYYSYATDYEPQGRYCYPMVVALIMLMGSGFDFLIKRIPIKIVKNILTVIISACFIALELFAFIKYYLPAE